MAAILEKVSYEWHLGVSNLAVMKSQEIKSLLVVGHL